VGGYLDATDASHGCILDNGQYTTVDFPGANGTVLTGRNPSGEMTGFSCVVASCASGTTHSFTVSKKGAFKSFDPPAQSAARLTRREQSSALIRTVRSDTRLPAFTTGRMRRLIFPAQFSRSLEGVTPRATS
jgi:type 1 fimbria pilin